MRSADEGDDTRAIQAIIARQFGSLSWGRDRMPDWEGFEGDFHPTAVLFASARPARPQSIQAFVDRMKLLSATSLRSFDEVLLGTEIRVSGNVAVAVAACEATENETDVGRNVEMLLPVKDEGQWRIVAQAWDRASPALPVPNDLLERGMR